MTKQGEGVMTFEKWKEAMSKEIFLFFNDNPGFRSKIFDLFDEDIEEEETKPLRLEKK